MYSVALQLLEDQTQQMFQDRLIFLRTLRVMSQNRQDQVPLQKEAAPTITLGVLIQRLYQLPV